MTTTSTVDDQGAIAPRVSLIRPTARSRLTLADLHKSEWRQVLVAQWQAAWNHEVAEISPVTTRQFFLICGLLPIWNSLDSENLHVFRLQTEDGERWLGRMVEADKMATLAQSLGLQQADLSGAEIYLLVM